MRRKPYRFLPHTADVLVAVQGRTLKQLFENCAAALFDLVSDRRAVKPRRQVRFTAQGIDLDNLLVRFLSELLFLQETRRWRFRSCRVGSIDRRQAKVAAMARGEPFDAVRHPRRREVKAVTYHQLRLMRRAGLWRVRLVFDV